MMTYSKLMIIYCIAYIYVAGEEATLVKTSLGPVQEYTPHTCTLYKFKLYFFLLFSLYLLILLYMNNSPLFFKWTVSREMFSVLSNEVPLLFSYFLFQTFSLNSLFPHTANDALKITPRMR